MAIVAGALGVVGGIFAGAAESDAVRELRERVSRLEAEREQDYANGGLELTEKR